jgi:hypothetical protein
MPTGTRPAPPAHTVRVALSGSLWSHKWVNVWWLSTPSASGVTTNDMKTLADGIAAAWATNVAPVVHTGITLTQVSLEYFPGDGTVLDYVGTYSTVGSRGTGPQDAACSTVVDWVISAYYRGGHPRSYIGAPASADISNGSDLSSAFLTACATGMNAFRNAVNALAPTTIGTVTMGTVSFVTNHAYRGTALFRAYTSVKIRSKIGSQRRRILS